MEFEKSAKQLFLEEVSPKDSLLQESGAKCAWYNLSCALGNNGKICTYSHECSNACN